MDKTVYTITCPHCGAKYSTYDYTKLKFTPEGFKYCALCHKSFKTILEGGGGGENSQSAATYYTPKV